MLHSDPKACHRSACSISMALEAIGDKWSLLILRDLMFTDKRTYGDLQSSDEKIATNVLASRLQSLEANGMIRKSADPFDKRRSCYLLTGKGIDLLPVIVDLKEWAERYHHGAQNCTAGLQINDKNRQEMLAAYMKKLRHEHGVNGCPL